MGRIWGKVDLTILKRITTSKDIINLCKKVKYLKTVSVYVPSYYLSVKTSVFDGGCRHSGRT